MQIRLHRGSYASAMETAEVINPTVESIREYLIRREVYLAELIKEIVVRPYSASSRSATGREYIVLADGNPVAFCDSPLGNSSFEHTFSDIHSIALMEKLGVPEEVRSFAELSYRGSCVPVPGRFYMQLNTQTPIPIAERVGVEDFREMFAGVVLAVNKTHVAWGLYLEEDVDENGKLVVTKDKSSVRIFTIEDWMEYTKSLFPIDHKKAEELFSLPSLFYYMELVDRTAQYSKSTYVKKPIAVIAHQWFKNGDHPLDEAVEMFDYPTSDSPDAEIIQRPQVIREGEIVRYFRHPDVKGTDTCPQCNNTFHDHGFIDTLEGGHRVCPGDWIIQGVKGEFYPCKPDIFEATYDKVENG